MTTTATRQAILCYYAATALFLLLDYLFGLNFRIAFLDGAIGVRAGYYAVCFLCLALILWRPRWSVLVGAFESLITMVALILSMAIGTMVPSDAFVEHQAAISVEELVNFLISGSIAYWSWNRGIEQLKDGKIA